MEHHDQGVQHSAPGHALRGVFTEDKAAALAARNARRLPLAQAALGDVWLLARPVQRPATPPARGGILHRHFRNQTGVRA